MACTVTQRESRHKFHTGVFVLVLKQFAFGFRNQIQGFLGIITVLRIQTVFQIVVRNSITEMHLSVWCLVIGKSPESWAKP